MYKLMFALLLLGCVTLCPATTIFDNLTGITPDGQDPVLLFDPASNGVWGPLLISFSTLPGDPFHLTSVTVRLSIPQTDDFLSGDEPDEQVFPTGIANVDLRYATGTIDNPGVGSVFQGIGSVSDFSLPALGLTQDVVLPTNVNLLANTRYWLAISCTVCSMQWSNTGDISGTGVVYDISNPQNGEFLTNGNVGFTPYTDDNGAWQAKIEGNQYTPSVPEPAAMILVGSALLGLGFGRFAKGKKARAV